jgi:hypothetical protein
MKWLPYMRLWMAFFAGVYAPARAAAVADAPADVFGTDLFADGDAGPPRLDLAPFLTDFFPRPRPTTELPPPAALCAPSTTAATRSCPCRLPPSA